MCYGRRWAASQLGVWFWYGCISFGHKFRQLLTLKQRCWHDGDDIHIHEPLIDPLLRPLKRGEVGVSFYPDNTREILPESQVELLDRPLQTGDICKRKHDDVQSAVVTKSEVTFKVSHAVNGQTLDQRFTLADIEEDEDVAVGDFVVYDDWVGQVQNVCIYFG